MKSKGALAFFVLAVFPPLVLTACGKLFGQAEADAGADAAVVEAVVDAAAVPTPEATQAEELAPADSAEPAKIVVVTTKDGGAKIVDAGSLVVPDAAAVVIPDAGKIPTPVPPSSWKIPNGLPSSLGSLKIPSGWPKLPTK